MMETVSAPVWEPDEGGALPWIGLITRSSPSRHYPLINHVMINTFDGGLIILFSWPPSCLIITLTPWCQWSMSFDSSLLLITNQCFSSSTRYNKYICCLWLLDIHPPSYDDIDEGQLIIWAAASSPITRTTTWCLGPFSLSVRDTQTKEDPPSYPRLLLHPSSFFWALFLQKRHIVNLFVCVYHSFYLYSLRLVRLECLECTFCTGATSLNDGCFRFEWLAKLECCNTSSTAGFLQRQRFELRKHQQHIFASPIITVCVFGKLRFYPHIDSYLFCSRF